MPDMNGFTVCESIRNYVSCPIIFLTARVEDCDKIKGFAVGADDYVVKPFSIDELEARVAAHLRREKRHSSSAIVQFDKSIVTVSYTHLLLITHHYSPHAYHTIEKYELQVHIYIK